MALLRRTHDCFWAVSFEFGPRDALRSPALEESLRGGERALARELSSQLACSVSGRVGTGAAELGEPVSCE